MCVLPPVFVEYVLLICVVFIALFGFCGVRVAHLCCVYCFVCLRFVYSMFPVSLDCPFLIAPSGFSNIDS